MFCQSLSQSKLWGLDHLPTSWRKADSSGAEHARMLERINVLNSGGASKLRPEWMNECRGWMRATKMSKREHE